MLRPLIRSCHSIRLNALPTRKYGSKVIPTRTTSFKRKALLTAIAASGIGLAYDGILQDFQSWGGIERFMRSLKIAVVISADYAWTLYGVEEGSDKYDEIMKSINLRSAEKLLKGCLQNGGLYIKIGQGVSAINHILPKEYTDTLKKLENECLPRSTNEVKRLFLHDFGKTPEEMFKTFDYEPIAAASLAQVFKATTHNGEHVAVKVQYNDLQKRFAGDFATILFLQRLVKFVHKNYNFSWILEDLRGSLEMEMDFKNEGENAEKCAKHLAKFNFVHVPKVFWDLTNERVVTAEWIDGCKISDLKEIEKQGMHLADLDKKLFDTFSEQIFSTGFVHADPHPGNIFVRRNPQSGKPQLVLLDHGLYQQIPEEVRVPLCSFWEAIVLKDEKLMQKYASQLDISDADKFAEILLQRPVNLKSSGAALSQKEIAYFQELAKKRFDIILDTLKEMPRNLLFVVRNLNTIRAIARDHGDPIDRPRHMARYAQICMLRNHRGLTGYVRWVCRRFYFEVALWSTVLQFWILRRFLNVLGFLKSEPELSSILDSSKKYDI